LRIGGVTFWSWTASVGFHIAVLVVLGLWKLSGTSAVAAARPVPSANIASVRRLSSTASALPKPKVSEYSRGRASKADEGGAAIGSMFAAEVSAEPEDTVIIARAADSMTAALVQASAAPRAVEFFGSSTAERKICYVVDCSGSMQGVFSGVQKKLKESIGQLRPNQYFYVIFFGGERLLEAGEGRLVRATDKAKAHVCSFVDSVQPEGKTNAAAALARSLEIRDEAGDRPSVVYFLTDGFELDPRRAETLSQGLVAVIRSKSPSTKINTIGFWPQESDRAMLESIAALSGGEAVFVTEDRW
jgi:Mg-chelatase subunit ChlD